MGKSKAKRSGTRSQASLRAKREAELQRDNARLAMIGFCVVAVVAILVGVVGLELEVVPVCLLIIIEVGIAVLLHHVELWIHGVLVLGEIIAGVIVGQIVMVFLCVAVYVAATFALKFLNIGEK